MSLLTRVLPVPVYRKPGDGRSILTAGPESDAESDAEAKNAEPGTTSINIPNPEPATLERKVKQPRPTGRKPNPDPRKGGQPRHVATTVRDIRITSSFSREEAALLSALARDSGYSFSSWLRRVIFDVAKVAARPHPERGTFTGSVATENKVYLEPEPPPPLPDRAYDRKMERAAAAATKNKRGAGSSDPTPLRRTQEATRRDPSRGTS